MAAFDDGTPLDAAALQDLDRRLTEVKSSIPKIGTTVINNNTTIQEIKQKQIVGGLQVNACSPKAGTLQKFTITFNGKNGLDSVPTGISITPQGAGSKASMTFYIEKLDQNSCTGQVWVPKGDTPPSSIGLHYVVVCS